ncbi:MAG: acyl carrier protein [Chloroflexi bacterium]|nr:acyl carrier protein [Chloroflexota bacterium]
MRDELEVIEQVRSIMAETFGLDEDELPEDLTQNTFSAWTSLKHMLLMAGLEERFSIELSMDEMLAMKSQADIVRILRSRVTAAV